MYTCPNNHKIDHVLVCGGPADINEANRYFQMTLTGEYTNLLADGTVGVTDAMVEHANDGCVTEPICPVCRDLCINESPGAINFEVGETYITQRAVAISNFGEDQLDTPAEYPKGEVFEVLEFIELDGKPSYVITFWQDQDTTYLGHPITYHFDKDTLAEWLTEDKEDL